MKILKSFHNKLIFFLASSLTAFPLLMQAQINMPMQQGPSSSAPESTTKEKASPDSATVYYFCPNSQGSYELKKVTNKTLYRIQDYDAIQHEGIMSANLGNTGSASNPLVFRLNTMPSFDLWLKNFKPYEFSFDSNRYYISDSPYTRLNYVMGSAKEQRLNVTHSQQIRKGLTLALNARFANSPGLYDRQRTYYTGMTGNASYITPGNRYGVIATYLNDRFRVYENGGLKYDTVFTDNVSTNRKTALVNLNQAMNRQKTGGVMVQQYFNLQKSRIAEVDSLGKPVRTRRFDAGRFVHTFRYYRQSAVYEDLKPNALYYPAIYLDSLLTYDTSRLVHFENDLVYSNIEPDTSDKQFPLQYAFGIKQLSDRLLNDTLTISFTHLVPYGIIRGIIKGKTFFTASGRIYLGDYNNGDHELKGEFYQFIGMRNEYRLWISVSNNLVHPDYFYQRYLSNHYTWDNDLKAQSIQHGAAGIDVKGLKLSATISRISNFTFLDQESKPSQSGDGIGVVTFNLADDLMLGHWILGAEGTWQKSTSEAVLRLPAVVARLTICYNLNLFKDALKTQAGIDVRYNTSFLANAYNPALRSFYLQDSEKLGNYPYGSAFVNFRVKRARIFVKYQHLNAGLLGYNYFMVPGYPQADAALKFGVNWVFFD